MKVGMKIVWVILNVTLVGLVLGILFWLTSMPKSDPGKGIIATTMPTQPSGPPLRIGLIPERDIFKQRKRYLALRDYLSVRLNRPVELVTLKTYDAVLRDFAEEKIDGAFLGSLVALLAMDRLGARVVAKPELPGGVSTYHGVLFVRDDSPVRRLEQLSGRSIGMVRTTTAGHLFGGCLILELKLWGQPEQPRIVWVGTHDDVALKVMEGQLDAGAIKNLRLDAQMRLHPEWKVRVLARGKPVPSNGLILRKDVFRQLGPTLSQVLLNMNDDPQGRKTLAAMGVTRFLPCRHEDYAAIYDMVECIRPKWEQIGVPGTIPKRPSHWPKPAPEASHQCYDVSY